MRKMEKIMSLVLVGTVLCGSSLSVNAACGHASGTHPVLSYTESESAGTHIYGTGKVCNLTKITDHYKVICDDCLSVLSTYSTSYQKHSVNH